jgi:hypothetical protein
MVIDVLINSCARPDILEVSINTFRKFVKTSHELRYVIMEDKVRNIKRQNMGREWILDHADLFDEIHFVDKKMGSGFFFAPLVALCKSDYFFHLEDDNEFITKIKMDPLIDLLKDKKNFVEIMMSRGKINKKNNPKKKTINGIELTEFDLFSVATGIFKTELVRKLIDKIGWDKQLHEAGVLTPISKKLKMRKFVLGHDAKHYKHVGEIKEYRKGAWKHVK